MEILVKEMRSIAQPRSIDEYKDVYALGLASLRVLMGYLQPLTDELQKDSQEIAQGLPLSREKAYIYMMNCTGGTPFEPDQIVRLCLECIQFFTELGDDWGKALSILILGDAYNFLFSQLTQATDRIPLQPGDLLQVSTTAGGRRSACTD